MADAYSIISHTLLKAFAEKMTMTNNSLSEAKIKLDAHDQHWIGFEDLYFQIFTDKNTEK